MKVGLLSDTHGNLSRTETALALLREAGAEHIIHCGDLGSDEVLSLLFEIKENGIPVTAVPGNVDEGNAGLMIYAKNLGMPLVRTARFTLEGKRCVVFHGHDPRLMDGLLEDPEVDILFTGHTHVPRDEGVGHVRVINPGAVHRAQHPGVAVLDTLSGALGFHPLP